MIETFLLPSHTAGASVYARVFNVAGEAFDFGDDAFKALGSATTPHVAATERADLDGTSLSGYAVAIDLAEIHPGGGRGTYLLRFYANASPAAADVAIGEPIVFHARFGDRVDAGDPRPQVRVEISVKSSEGLAAQVAVWLEHGGRKIPIADVDAAATASVTVREHGSGVDLFTLAMTAADLEDDYFEAEQATPGFVDDRQYAVTAEIVENGNTWSTPERIVVLG